jgi:hypothetical protein
MSSLTSLRTKRISGSRKFRSPPPKDFFNSIGTKRTWRDEARLRQNTGGKRDHESWPVQHAWLAKRLNDMHRVFVNRVSEIDADT